MNKIQKYVTSLALLCAVPVTNTAADGREILSYHSALQEMASVTPDTLPAPHQSGCVCVSCLQSQKNIDPSTV